MYPVGGHPSYIIEPNSLVLVTGARGFVGSRTVEALLSRGFQKIRCLVRDETDLKGLAALLDGSDTQGRLEICAGNLLSRDDCRRITTDVQVVYHLAAGTGQKSFADAYLNSVVTTRNLLDACVEHRQLKRFVSISSFAVYSNRDKPNGRLLDETAPVEDSLVDRGEAYCFAKLRQDQLVQEYGARFGIPYVLLRPGVVYGPGKPAISGRVGRELGLFLHFGGSNHLPLTYVDNCAEAIVLAGLVPGAENEIYNIVDDDLPSSRQFLSLYKKHVRRFRSLYVPRPVSFALCYFCERYSRWSRGQLPPVFNRLVWHAYWKRTAYTNSKLKQKLGWTPSVSTAEGLNRFFASCRNA